MKNVNAYVKRFLIVACLSVTAVGFSQSKEWNTPDRNDNGIIEAHIVDLAEKSQADLLYELPEHYEVLESAAYYIIFPEAVKNEGSLKKGILFKDYEPLKVVEVSLDNNVEVVNNKAIIFDTEGAFEDFTSSGQKYQVSELVSQ